MYNYIYDSRTLPDDLYRMRLSTGLSQRDVADSLGLTRQAITNYEKGTRVPTLNTLSILLEFYGYYLRFDKLN